MTFGDKVKQARLAANLSQSELARKTGISERSLYSYERGGIMPRSGNIRKIAEALNVSVGYLLDGDETDTKKNIDNIREVIDIVKRYKIQRWKLFKFISLRGKSLENKNEFYIEDEKYEKLINEIRKEQISCPIDECKERDIENNYLLIDPIGNFIITVDSKDKIICNLENEKKEEIEGILRNEFRRKLGSI